MSVVHDSKQRKQENGKEIEWCASSRGDKDGNRERLGRGQSSVGSSDPRFDLGNPAPVSYDKKYSSSNDNGPRYNDDKDVVGGRCHSISLEMSEGCAVLGYMNIQ